MAVTNRKNRGPQIFQPSFNGLTLEIPNGQYIQRGKVILKGSVTIAGGTTNGTAVGEGGSINLIKLIEIVCNPAGGGNMIYPGGNVVYATPRSLLHWAQMQTGKFVGEMSGSTLGNGAPGTYPIYLSIPIFFSDENLRNQVQTALPADASIFSSIQLQVSTGGATDCFAGTDRVWTYNLQVQWDDSRVDMAAPANPMILFQEDHSLLIQAAMTRLNDPGMPNTGEFLSWLVMGLQGTSYTLSDAILNRVTAQSQTWDFDEFAQDIRADMYECQWLDPSQNAAGLYMIDQTEGIIQNRNPAPGMLKWFDVNNPSGASLDQLLIFTRRVYAAQQASS